MRCSYNSPMEDQPAARLISLNRSTSNRRSRPGGRLVNQHTGTLDAMAKIRKVGRGATIITLLSNPMVRRAVLKGATRVANSASSYIAARTEKKSPPPEQPASFVPEKAVASKAPAKPSSLAETAAVETIVGSVASAAKPVAERLASTSAGRSVLQAVNSITGQALGSADGPKRAGGSMATFVGNILANQATTPKSQPASDKPAVKFRPVTPPSTPPVEPVETMVWPPKSSNGSEAS